jgi:predicted nucleotidyltransferase
MGNTASRKGSSLPRAKIGLAEALFTAGQRRVLGLLFGQPERSFFTKELIDLSGIGSGAVQRELTKLLDSGLVMQTVVGNQKHYRANPDAPIYDALVDIVQKTMGVAGAVRAALTPLSGEILFAILYGSVAKGADRAQSDIDVLIVSDTLPLDRIFATLEPVEKAMGRTVSPTVYTSGEFLRRRSQSNTFLTRVLDGAHVVLLGAEDDVGAS